MHNIAIVFITLHCEIKIIGGWLKFAFFVKRLKRKHNIFECINAYTTTKYIEDTMTVAHIFKALVYH